MRNTNCRIIRREIEEARSANFLSAAARSHLEVCPDCESVSRQQIKLRAILSSLDTVEAPADFDYRLRARMAAEKRLGARVLPFGNFSFGFGSAAAVAVVLLIGSAFIFVSFRSRSQPGVAGLNQPSSNSVTAVGQSTSVNGTKAGPVQVATIAKNNAEGKAAKDDSAVRRLPKAFDSRREVAGLTKGKPLGTIDQAQTGAQVDRLGETYPSAAFPINASYQSLKVSVDDARGTARTISLPSVSFGSQRTLSQTASPLIASARDTW
jgi:hypothetical protein